MPIIDIFKKDIKREINGVVKAGVKDKVIIQNEIDEYVITKEISRNMQKLFSNYAESFNNSTENVGVWIDGFFGSGKSHLLKMVGNILSNTDFDGKTVYNYFEEKTDDKILLGNIKKASEAETDVILFDIGKISDQDGISSKNSIIVALQRKFNEFLGFIKEDLKLAEFERFLWRENKFDEYKELYKAKSGCDWMEDRKNFDFRQNYFIDIIDKMDLEGFDEDAAERWLEKESIQAITAESFTEFIVEYLEKVGNKRRLVFLIDEIGQFIGDSSALILNLQSVVEEIGKIIRGKVWFMVTAQQGIVEIIEQKTVKIQDFSKIQDRFKTRLPLSSANVDEVIKRRLLEKKEEAKISLMSFYEDKRIDIENLITFEKNDFKLNLYKEKVEFAETYPFVPYQFTLLQKVFEKIRKMSHSGQHQSKGERSLLDAFHSAGNKIINEDIGIIVPFHDFYNSMEQFLEDTVRRPIIQASEQYGMDEFEVNVLKLLFLIKGIDEIKTNVDNIASFMVSHVNDNRIDLKKKIEKALRKLEKQYLVQRNGEEYFFLTDDEQDINREIKDVKVDNVELLRELNDIIFNGILNTNKIRVKETGNSYNFIKKIDEQYFSQQNAKLVCHLVSPYHDEHKDESALRMYTQRDPWSLFVRLEDIDGFMEEIREYLQIDRYVSDKLATNPVDNIMRILQIKQSEKRGRYARIKDYVSKSLEGTKYILNGTEIEVKSRSPKERLLEGLEKYAMVVYRNAGLVKNHYDEKKIKDILSYDYTGATLFNVEKELSSNPNYEAIREVENYMKDLDDRHDVINMKKLVDKFSDTPFGWDILDIQGIITELFVISRITLTYDHKEVEATDSNAVNIITRVKTSNQENLLIAPKGEKPIEEIRKAISLLKKLYGVGNNFDENKFESEARKFLDGKKNLANRLIRFQYGKNREFEYPGKSDLEEYVEIIEDILDNSKSEKELCDNIIKEYDDFDEVRVKVDTINNFFEDGNSKKELFDSGIRKLEQLEMNYSYGDLKNSSAAKAIKEILSNKDPYHDLYKITDYINQIDKEIKDIIDNEKDNIKTEINSKIDEVKTIFKDVKESNIIIEKIEKRYSDLIKILDKTNDTNVFQLSGQINRIENQLRADFVSEIIEKLKGFENKVMDVLKDKDNVDELIKEVAESFNKIKTKVESSNDVNVMVRELEKAEEEKDNWINVANGKAPKKERITIRRKRIDGKSLESREQVDEYIKQLEADIQEIKKNLLEAVKENKRVDVY